MSPTGVLDRIEEVVGCSADELMAAARSIEVEQRALDARRASVLAALDRSGVTVERSGLKAAGWVAREVAQHEGRARERVRVSARLAGELAPVADALAAGRIGWDHVQVIDRAANPRIVDQIVAVVPELVELAELLPFSMWSAEVRATAETFDEDGGYRPEADPDRNIVRLSKGFGGELGLEGRFVGEWAAEVRGLVEGRADVLFHRYRQAAEAAGQQSVAPGRPQLLAQSVLELLFQGAGVDLHSTTPPKPEVVVVVEPDGHAHTLDGTRVSRRTLGRWACRAELYQVTLGADGNVTQPASPLADLDPHSPVGQVIARALGIDHDHDDDRGPRFANREQRRAIAVRDGCCVVPGCGVPVAWCDIHHVIFWEDGGPTILPNLAPLCRFHHGLSHRAGWSMHATDDGWFWWQTPDGTTFWSQRHGLQRAGPTPRAG